MSAPHTRRAFLTATALAATARYLPAQSSRIDIASLEHDHILAEAATALQQPIQPPPAQRFYTEASGNRTHADALRNTSAAIAALTAAFVLTREDNPEQAEKYVLRAAGHLHAWFIAPATALTPTLEGAYGNATSALAKAPGLIDAVPLAEIARSLQFLQDVSTLTPAKAWFADLLAFLTTDRTALIARDMRDHTASAWLLIASAIARFLADSTQLAALRHRFKQPTLRNQIQATGIFHHEVVTAAPFRNSLFNFDLLGGACELLSTPFASLWPYELEDGPGMRAVSAFLFQYIKAPTRWPYPADDVHFREVPLRRPALLFAARAYTRPEYLDLWKSVPYTPTTDPLAYSLPIRQPLLWITRVPHENLA